MTRDDFWYIKNGKERVLNKDSVNNHIEYLKRTIQDYENRIKVGNLNSNHDFYSGIAHCYTELAFGHTYLGNENQVIIGDYKKAVLFRIKQQEYRGFSFNNSWACLAYSICTRDKKFIKETLQTQMNNHLNLPDKPEWIHYEFDALFNLISNFNNNITNYKIEQFCEIEKKMVKKIQGGTIGSGLAMKSILNKDFDNLLAGISQIITKFKRTYRKYGRLPISWNATYLIFLARDKGMAVPTDLLKGRYPEKDHIFFKQCLMMD